MDPEPNDEELLRRSTSGDGEAFAALMARHEDRIFGLALRITGERSDALDATQDAFVTVFRKARSFRGESAFSTWLYRIAINACNDILRKRKRYVLVEDASIDRRPVGADMSDHAGDRIDVRRALAMLTPEYRDAVALHDLAGLPYEDVARITGAQLGTVKSRISRGRRRLAELLEQPGDLPASKEVT